MKKLFFFLLPLLAAGWLLPMGGCKVLNDSENRQKPPAGMVLEFGTEKPIPEAQVLLLDYNGEFMGGHGFTELDNQVSDQNGAYDFKTVGFLVTAKKDGYFTNDQTGEIILSGSERHTDIHLYPHAWMRVILKNESGAYGITIPGETSDANGKVLNQPINETQEIQLFRGGNETKRYMFSVIPTEGQPASTELSALTVLNQNGEKIALTLENCVTPCFEVYLTGHDTTSITITY